MERREPSEQLKRVLEEVGLNTELFLQRLFFAMWMDDGYTLDEIVSNYFYYPTLAVPCEKTLQRWRKLWLENDFHLQDSRSGSSKPRDLVHRVVLEEFAKDPSQSARDISKKTGYSIATVTRHLKMEGLQYGKFIKVPYNLTPEQRSRRVECATQMLQLLEKAKKTNYASILTLDETPIQLQNERSEGWYSLDSPTPCYEAKSLRKKKFTLTIVWGTGGVAVVDACDGGLRINSANFCENTIAAAIGWCKNKRKVGGVESFVFHMDNAPCHNSRATREYLEENKVVRIDHPPYSPDLAPCDFYLFGYIKNTFANTVFNSVEDAVEEITAFVEGIPKKQLIAVFDEWRRRLQSCIERKGEYTFLPSKDDCGEKGGASGKNPSRNGAKERPTKRRRKNR